LDRFELHGEAVSEELGDFAESGFGHAFGKEEMPCAESETRIRSAYRPEAEDESGVAGGEKADVKVDGVSREFSRELDTTVGFHSTEKRRAKQIGGPAVELGFRHQDFHVEDPVVRNGKRVQSRVREDSQNVEW
jgi:hypothetical protein